MITSRVESTTSSIFRNAKQYWQANEMSTSLMQEELEHGFAGQQNGQKRRKRREKAERRRSAVLKRNAENLVMESTQHDANTMAAMQNNLLKRSEKIMNAQKMLNSIRAYETSI
ncbi:hypothetical protein D1B33_16955 [Lysinibacillus yapensis]|uniref:Uncharacterized protein n=1 Tax=Ureibacillus yapensis TaxID=2304605 RepID=A0A396S386_9BACL|nr:hypothetical protein [Lysinibacillus yapensis]RHW32424.1 hypothetical protein D1B33_16955 [Lysinibacillus yapensis]